MKTLSYQTFKPGTQPQNESVAIGDTAETFLPKEPLTNPPKVLIVIPAYNEGKNIGAVLGGIQKQSPGIPILVVNDGSSDNTEKVVLEHNANVINLPYNSGYGIALQTGFLYAVKNNYSIVVQMDSDGQHDPANIKDLVEEVQKEDCDVVIGSRFLSKDSYKSSLPRHAGMLLFGGIASILCGRKVTDPTSGFQALKGRAIQFVASDNYPPDYPDADFIILLNRCGFKVKEIPVTMHASPKKESMHHGHKTIYYVFKMFLSIFVTLLRKSQKR
ncbi:MAG: glycosyl transferase family 2 [Nitrospinae bacterium CG22_combo_CG10-13_8_21_14_all_47_10]|nr:MAG: glycosyl transferase family 2 [Nitrospinae bacterium CG22_combo_CG10-13_8_21_14_all_47_10]